MCREWEHVTACDFVNLSTNVYVRHMTQPRRRVIPDATIARLPVYHRTLSDFDAQRRETVSSEQLAEHAGVNAAQVRKDLSYFGTYGTRGVGYGVKGLLVEIQTELGLTQEWRCVIVGAGNLGMALAKFAGFTERGFTVVGVVDIDPNKVGVNLGDITIEHQDKLEDIVRNNGITIGILTTPPHSAQDAADRLVAAGVQSILNFAPVILDVPYGVQVRDVDVAVELQILAFHEQRRGVSSEN